MCFRWIRLSIAQRLYIVFCVMSVLIAGELLVLRFSMRTLSAVRAFVDGEGLWSKAQKNASLVLRRYEVTRDEEDFKKFLGYMKVANGDRRARLELEKEKPDMAVVRQGFLDGGVHPSDIDGVTELLVRFHWVSYLDRAIQAWKNADDLLVELQEKAQEFRILLQEGRSPQEIRAVSDELYSLNTRLTLLEDEFSRQLGEGSRWLEATVLKLLFFAVLFVEGIGLTLTLLTARSISARMKGLTEVADSIGQGDFTRKAKVENSDEIGTLAESVNRMGALLGRSYRELERRVHDRTQELEDSVQVRDDFLSLASHELKTPITSLKLQMQLRIKAIQRNPESAPRGEELIRVFEDCERQVNRLVRLVDEMLDISRLDAGKFRIDLENIELGSMVTDVVGRLGPSLDEVACATEVRIDERIEGSWDRFRLEQVLTNLLTNSMRYAPGKPIRIRLWREGDLAMLSVADEGIGISHEDQKRVFQRFERGSTHQHAGGLGLGLYIIRCIVEAHGGSVLLKSEPERGSEFTIVLPIDGSRDFNPPSA